MIFKNNDKKLKKHCKIAETDKFWDIEDITPSKSNKKKTASFSEPETVLIEEKTSSVSGVGSIPISQKAEKPSELVLSYSPENSLVERVDIYTWPLKYTFYERFRMDARKYFNVYAKEARPIRYYSYMPSYTQMSIKQREWYFYWRDRVRNKEYLPTDSSYILLYVYEIINLPELIPAKVGLELMCDIWEQYRQSYTKLDKYMAEWVTDYCLINRLQLPIERLYGFLPEIISVSSLKQFFVKCENNDEYSSLLIEKASSYRWYKSKYITDENRAIFEKHIFSAVSFAVSRYALSDGRFLKENRLVERKILRDSFGGALCAYDVKRKLELVCYDLVNTADITFIITDTVRYCENRIRAYLGIRARLAIQNLTEEHKKIINEYFDKYLPAPFYEKKSKKVYEDTFVEEERKPFAVSYEKAKEIERESWAITDRLVEDIVDNDIDEDIEEDVEDIEETEDIKIGQSDESKSVEGESLDIAKQGLIFVCKNDMQSFVKLADESYMMPETLAECVNELCFEVLGDVGIEEKDGKYVVIPDYEQEIKQWLKL